HADHADRRNQRLGGALRRLARCRRPGPPDVDPGDDGILAPHAWLYGAEAADASASRPRRFDPDDAGRVDRLPRRRRADALPRPGRRAHAADARAAIARGQEARRIAGPGFRDRRGGLAISRALDALTTQKLTRAER